MVCVSKGIAGSTRIIQQNKMADPIPDPVNDEVLVKDEATTTSTTVKEDNIATSTASAAAASAGGSDVANDSPIKANEGWFS